MGPPEAYSKLVGREIEEDMKMEALPQERHSNVVEGKLQIFKRRDGSMVLHKGGLEYLNSLRVR
jgi:hypothetical protein